MMESNIPPPSSSSSNTENAGDLASLEKSLLASFRTAARSVTQLYKDAQKIQRHAHQQGYEQCLQDLLDFIAAHPNVQQRDARTGSALIPADDLVDYIRTQHARLLGEAEEHLPGSNDANTLANHPPSTGTSLPSDVMIFGQSDTNLPAFTFNTPYIPSTQQQHHHHHSSSTPLSTVVPSKRRGPPSTEYGRDIDMSEFGLFSLGTGHHGWMNTQNNNTHTSGQGMMPGVATTTSSNTGLFGIQAPTTTQNTLQHQNYMMSPMVKRVRFKRRDNESEDAEPR
jgi:hypothetical protein